MASMSCARLTRPKKMKSIIIVAQRRPSWLGWLTLYVYPDSLRKRSGNETYGSNFYSHICLFAFLSDRIVISPISSWRYYRAPVQSHHPQRRMSHWAFHKGTCTELQERTNPQINRADRFVKLHSKYIASTLICVDDVFDVLELIIEHDTKRQFALRNVSYHMCCHQLDVCAWVAVRRWRQNITSSLTLSTMMAIHPTLPAEGKRENLIGITSARRNPRSPQVSCQRHDVIFSYTDKYTCLWRMLRSKIHSPGTEQSNRWYCDNVLRHQSPSNQVTLIYTIPSNCSTLACPSARRMNHGVV